MDNEYKEINFDLGYLTKGHMTLWNKELQRISKSISESNKIMGNKLSDIGGKSIKVVNDVDAVIKKRSDKFNGGVIEILKENQKRFEGIIGVKGFKNLIQDLKYSKEDDGKVRFIDMMYALSVDGYNVENNTGERGYTIPEGIRGKGADISDDVKIASSLMLYLENKYDEYQGDRLLDPEFKNRGVNRLTIKEYKLFKKDLMKIGMVGVRIILGEGTGLVIKVGGYALEFHETVENINRILEYMDKGDERWKYIIIDKVNEILENSKTRVSTTKKTKNKLTNGVENIYVSKMKRLRGYNILKDFGITDDNYLECIEILYLINSKNRDWFKEHSDRGE